ncbi:alkaline phosphatase D family protein [Micromonospora carbonacea]|uniref:Phosphodiesterase/alkaline phosphatase D n=1 Tax=Micromonospora carbonacea TaxID=47853 RepID=A0A1C4WZX1_9ACTN|nr:alkaline phosphatase D family protein [Micromonospora carbonacea]SCF01694.1 Phosphodiesterase/alkaline phosphatase D [Micromonospora carbonacea]
MAVINAWVGATTPSSARVVAKIGGASARLAVADNPQLSGPAWYGPVSASAEGIVSLTATGLAPNRRYWWAVEDAGVLDTVTTGRFRTHPPLGEPATFDFITGGDAGITPEVPGVGAAVNTSRLSNHPVFDTIRLRDPLFFAHLGDLHYYDLGSNNHGFTGATLANYRRAYDDVLLQPRQHELYRNVSTFLLWDDHDFGPNDSDSTAPGRANAQRVYRERVPHYPLADDEAIFHSFEVGRVLFVGSDSRSDRTPNSYPDGADKTMLGSAQRAWLEQLLTRSEASALCWLMPVQWLSGAVDSWGGFRYEQGQLAQMLGDLGWLSKMWMVVADKHSLGIDTGANNLWGGFPNFLTASLDAGGGDSTGPYDLGITGGRNRYTRFVVDDQGDQIIVQGTGYIGTSPWRSHTFSILANTPPPTDGGGQPVPPQTPATIADRVSWLGCDLVTGQIIADLPDITGTVSRVLGAYTSSSLSMPVPVSGPAALGDIAWQATQPGTTMIVAVVNGVPEWGGIVMTRRGGTDGTVDLGCVTLEGYLDRRYVGDHDWVQRDEVSVIAAGLIADAQVDGIGLAVDAPATGVLRDRSYVATDDATVYSRLRELSGVEGGPEWTIDLDWTDSTRTRVAKILRVRPRIGAASSTPGALFSAGAPSWSSTGASDARYTLVEDYSDGRGANYVLATSSGEGDARPQSQPAADIRPGWARYDRRYSPGSSITDTAVLDEHAAAELALRVGGAATWQIDSRWDAYPRLGVDWRLGDDVAWELHGHRHPNGVTGIGRVIGWELDIRAGRVKPILWEPGGN